MTAWREVLNTQPAFYGGSNAGNMGKVNVVSVKGATGSEDFIDVVVPANGTLWLKKG